MTSTEYSSTSTNANAPVTRTSRAASLNLRRDLGWIDFPRIHFCGRFRANPCTDNNVPTRFPLASELGFKEYQEQQLWISHKNMSHDNWNPFGDASWSFEDCTVMNAYTKEGEEDSTLNGAMVNPANNRIVGTLVDLDVDQQGISRIYGFNVNIASKPKKLQKLKKAKKAVDNINNNNNTRDIHNNSHVVSQRVSSFENTLHLQSKYEASSFTSMWMRTRKGFWFGGYSANYISVLTQCQFDDFSETEFPALNDLRSYAAANGQQLSIRFVVDGYNIAPFAKAFQLGRVYGVIGVYCIGHPRRSLKHGRWISSMCNSPMGPQQPIWLKYDKVAHCLHMDLSNALPTDRGPGEDQLLWPRNIDSGTITLHCNGKAILNIELAPERYSIVRRRRTEEVIAAETVYSDKFTAVMTAHNNCVTTTTTTTTTIVEEKEADANANANANANTNAESSARLAHLRQELEELIEKDGNFVFGPESQRNPEEWRKNSGIYTFKNVYIDDEDDFYRYPLSVQWSDMNTSTRKFKAPTQPSGDPAPSASPDYTSTAEENRNGVWVQSESLQMRLGTSGKFPLFGNKKVLTVFISVFGAPLTAVSSTENPLKPSSAVIGPRPPTPWTYGAWPINVSFRDVLQNKFYRQLIYDGFYSFEVIAPPTLVHQRKLPRAPLYMDSLVYSLTCTYTGSGGGGGGGSGAKAQAQAKAKTKVKHVMHVDVVTSSNRKTKNPVQHGSKTAAQIDPWTQTEFSVGSVLVFDESGELPVIPTWQPNAWADINDEYWKLFVLKNMYGGQRKFYIRPVLRQYANMYPVMRDIVNLDAYEDVTRKLPALQRAFNMDFENARYMPVSRDISGRTLVLINSWLMNPVYSNFFIDPSELEQHGGFAGGIRTVATLKQYLQMAIELELSTLPPYLSALYSIDPNSAANANIIGILRSIVRQEMSHLALACNLLLSIGGKPRIAFRDVVERTTFPRLGLVNETIFVNADAQNKIKSKQRRPQEVRVLPDLPLALGPYSIKASALSETPSVMTFMHIEAPADFEIIESKEDSIIKEQNTNSDTVVVDNDDDEERAAAAAAVVAATNKLMTTSEPLRVYQSHALQGLPKKLLQTLLDASNSKLLRKYIHFIPRKPNAVAKDNRIDSNHNSGAVVDDQKEEDANAVNVNTNTNADADADDNGGGSHGNFDPTQGESITVEPIGPSEYSIGAFYELIRKGFFYCAEYDMNNESLFVMNKEEAAAVQCGADVPTMTIINVYDMKTAMQAIESIVSEGEGTSMTDLWSNDAVGSAALSHYHKFLELYVQRPILTVKQRPVAIGNRIPFEYVFANDIQIPFDASTVVSDPPVWQWLQSGDTTQHRHARDKRVIRFNDGYGRLLISLQEIFGDGKPENLGNAIGVMRQLQIHFSECVRPPTSSGQTENDETARTILPRIAPNWVPSTDIIPA